MPCEVEVRDYSKSNVFCVFGKVVAAKLYITIPSFCCSLWKKRLLQPEIMTGGQTIRLVDPGCRQREEQPNAQTL